jgi:hypothetical protein
MQLEGFFRARKKLQKALPTEDLCTVAMLAAQENIDILKVEASYILDYLGKAQYNFWRAIQVKGSGRDASNLRWVLGAKGGVLSWKEDRATAALQCAHHSTIGRALAEKIASKYLYFEGLDRGLRSWHEAGRVLLRFSAVDPTWQIVGPGLIWWIEDGYRDGAHVTLKELVEELDDTLKPLGGGRFHIRC